MTNPDQRMDPWKEALNCYSYFSDDVFTVGENWEEEFKWEKIGQVFQEGFDRAEGDWVLNIALDMFIHEKYLNKLYDELKINQDEPVLALPKLKFFHPYRYQIMYFEPVLLNKKKFKNIKLNGGGDLCLPTLDGKLLEVPNIKYINIPLFNYDTTFRKKEIIAHDRARFARAWFRQFNSFNDRGGETPDEAFDAWYRMVKDRYKFHTNKAKLEDHPKFIMNSLKNLSHDQFGYDMFGASKNSFVFQNPKYRYNQLRIKQKYSLFNLI